MTRMRLIGAAMQVSQCTVRNVGNVIPGAGVKNGFDIRYSAGISWDGAGRAAACSPVKIHV